MKVENVTSQAVDKAIKLENLRKEYVRIQYLLENALSYLKDNDLINDFIEDRDIDITPDERVFYELETDE